MYAYITVSIKNIGKNNISYKEAFFKAQNNKGQIKGIDSAPYSDRLHSGELAPNGEIEGRLQFQIPVNDNSFILLYDVGIEQNKMQFDVNLR